MDLDLTVAQRFIRDTAAKFYKPQWEPIASDGDRSHDQKRYCLKEVAMAEGYPVEAANHPRYFAMQILGGYETIHRFPVESLFRNLHTTTISCGTSDICTCSFPTC